MINHKSPVSKHHRISKLQISKTKKKNSRLSKTCHWWYYIGIVSEGEVIDIIQYFIKKDIIKIEV